MATTWKLKRTAQCNGCPWRKDVDPNRDIPNYDRELHEGLRNTITEGVASLAGLAGAKHVMACHETKDAHCIGWLMNRLGPGNDIALRLSVRNCESMDKVRLKGDQHQRFEDTLPED